MRINVFKNIGTSSIANVVIAVAKLASALTAFGVATSSSALMSGLTLDRIAITDRENSWVGSQTISISKV